MIPRIKTNPIPFGYKTTVSKLFREGKLPTVIKGFYGGELSVNPKSLNRVSNEHLVPKSKGGTTELFNIVLATAKNNSDRSNEPLSKYFDKKAADEYWEQFKDVIVKYQDKKKIKVFDGNKYIKDTQNTVKKILTSENRLDLWG